MNVRQITISEDRWRNLKVFLLRVGLQGSEAEEFVKLMQDINSAPILTVADSPDSVESETIE